MALREKNRISAEDFIEQIEQVFKLHKNDILTDFEFSQRKSTLIRELQTKGIVGSPDAFLGKLIVALERHYLNQDDLKTIKSQLYCIDSFDCV